MKYCHAETDRNLEVHKLEYYFCEEMLQITSRNDRKPYSHIERFF
jgi:hypothetical protein